MELWHALAILHVVIALGVSIGWGAFVRFGEGKRT